MIVVRPAETDADLEAWIHVRRVVLPNESAGTLEQVRARRGENAHFVAELDGELAGSGVAGRSDVAGRGFVAPRVLPGRRRRGVGTALLLRLAEEVQALGFDRAGALATEPGSEAFARRFGFEEVGRQVEQVRGLGAVPSAFALPDGVEVVTLAERPELLEAAYPLACEAGYADMATDGPVEVSFAVWMREEGTLREGSFVALAGGEIVGYAGLVAHDDAGVAEDGLTVVRRDWRRRGLATALKGRELAWAAANGYREVVTWTQRGNEAMRAVNERLGYVYRDVAVTMVAPLPLVPG